MTIAISKRITRATFKSFLNKNRGKLYISNRSNFDGMTDCVQQCSNQAPRLAQPASIESPKNTMGIKGVWLVGRSRDYFQSFEDAIFRGIEVSNCCGNFVVAVLK